MRHHVTAKSLSGALDLLVVSMLACAATAAALAPAGVAVRTLLALPLVLVLPGYALLAAVLPRLDRWSAEGLAYSLGLSLAVASLTGLALNYTSWGIERRPLAVALAAVTLVAATAASARCVALGERHEGRRRARATPGHLLPLVVAALVAAAAIGIARLGAVQAGRRSTFTQLWMLPAKGSAGPPGTSLHVGIRNDEGTTETYRLLVRVGSRRLALWRSIVLGSGRQQVETVRLPADLPERQPVEAELFRRTQPQTIYRHVTFWPPPSTPAQ